MLSDFWQWLHDTSPGQATFLGSVFGFFALLGGALFNAWQGAAGHCTKQPARRGDPGSNRSTGRGLARLAVGSAPGEANGARCGSRLRAAAHFVFASMDIRAVAILHLAE
jgi:hypothetical protein